MNPKDITTCLYYCFSFSQKIQVVSVHSSQELNRKEEDTRSGKAKKKNRKNWLLKKQSACRYVTKLLSYHYCCSFFEDDDNSPGSEEGELMEGGLVDVVSLGKGKK